VLLMSHISGKQLLLASAAAITTLSLAATWYHAGHMTEGGAYTLLGTFMALFATVTLLVLLLIFGCYFAFIALFAILQQMNIPTMDDFIDWLDKHIKYDWTDGHTVASSGHNTWDILFTKPGSSRVALACVFVVLAKKPIAAILIYLFTML
jgi:uncharacterized membrane protein